MSERPRFAHLDGLRAMAAISVVLYHAAFLTGYSGGPGLGAITARLNVGVTLFFLISGFLLYRPYVVARCGGREALPTREFYRRRALRIVPAYWVALTALAVWPGLDGDVFSFPHGLWYYGFAQTLDPDTSPYGISPAWTLGCEVSFYLLLPLYAAGMRRWVGALAPAVQARREGYVLIALSAVSIVVRALQFTVLDSREGMLLVNLLPSYLLWFALGMGLAIVGATGVWPRAQRLVADHALACWGVGAVVLGATAWAGGLPQTFPGHYDGFIWNRELVLYAAVALCLLAPLTLGGPREGPVQWFLSRRPVALAGLVSYGIYLYHQPLLVEFSKRGWPSDILPAAQTIPLIAMGLAAAITCATVSYLVVEKPFLRLKGKSSTGR